MAKTNNTLRWVSIVIVLVGAVVSIVTAFTVYGEDIAHTQEEVLELKLEGCAPAQGHTTQIAVIQNTQKAMQSELVEIKEQQTDAFAEILRRLPKGE